MEVESGVRFSTPLIAITGPTAAGKTAVAVELARAIGGEIVGADSMQVYRYLDIGTDKPTADQLAGVAHHMIDLVAPDEDYHAARFVADADRVIAGIAARGKRAIVAGGTGLYIRALMHGLQGGPAPDPAIRAEINARAEQAGWPALHAELERVDSASAARLHPNDGVRILRALEVVQKSGVSMSEWQRRHGFSRWRYPVLLLGIERDREDLQERIDARLEAMMQRGFLEEVAGLIERGFAATLKPLQGLGYRRLCEHLAGELTIEEALEKTRSDTRRLARRQAKWFREEPGLEWVASDLGLIEERVARFYEEVS